MGLPNKSAFYDFTPVRISTDRGDFHFRGPLDCLISVNVRSPERP